MVIWHIHFVHRWFVVGVPQDLVDKLRKHVNFYRLNGLLSVLSASSLHNKCSSKIPLCDYYATCLDRLGTSALEKSCHHLYKSLCFIL